jgi:hypothetical protein
MVHFLTLDLGDKLVRSVHGIISPDPPLEEAGITLGLTWDGIAFVNVSIGVQLNRS